MLTARGGRVSTSAAEATPRCQVLTPRSGGCRPCRLANSHTRPARALAAAARLTPAAAIRSSQRRPVAVASAATGATSAAHSLCAPPSQRRQGRDIAAACSGEGATAAERAGSSKLPSTRRLILLRHADSDDGNARIKDHDRTISVQGKRQAASVAAQLQSRGWLPDLIVASNARRTRQTLDHMAAAVEQFGDVDAHFFGSLYTVAALDGQTRGHLQDTVLQLAGGADVDGRVACVMCVGHNRGWEEAASSLCGQVVSLKTASGALLECCADSWAQAFSDHSRWRLVEVVGPQGP